MPKNKGSNCKIRSMLVFSFSLLQGLIISGNATAETKIEQYCKSGDAVGFFKAISGNEALFNRYIVKNLEFGTRHFLTGAVYGVKNSNYEKPLFPFKYFQDGTWVENGTSHDLKPIYADLAIEKDSNKEFLVQWIRTDIMPGKDQNPRTFGSTKQFFYERKDTKSCWMLVAAYDLDITQ